jgi:hypothetical protein
MEQPSPTSDGKTKIITSTVIYGEQATGTAAPTSRSSSSQSHSGIIIGSVIGGIIALTAFAFILLFCIRRHHRTGGFDADFNPDRVDHGKHIDLMEDTVPGLITPFQYHQSPHVDGGMQQQGEQDSLYSPHYTPTSRRHSSVYMTPGRISDRNPGYIIGPGSVLPDGGGSAFTALDSGASFQRRSSWPRTMTRTSLSSNFLSSAYGGYVDMSTNESRSARDGETKGRYVKRVPRPTLMLASTLEGEEYNGESSTEGEQSQVSPASPQSPVLVHQDAGRVEPIQLETRLNAGVEEIPPTYDSLPASQM